MQKYITQTLLIGCFACISFNGASQNNTNSPYSMYGLGELKSQTNAHTSAMGNAGIGMQSDNFLNTLNPASYSGIDSLSFILEVGINGEYSNYDNSRHKANTFNGNLSYLAMGLKITPWLATGFGLNPYSSIGYEINTTGLVEGVQLAYPLDITGSGDLSRVYFSTAVSPLKNLSLGIESSFIFGNKKQTQYHDLSNLGITSVYNETTNYFHNFYFQFGLQYQLLLNKNNSLNFGITYCPKQELVTHRENTSYDENDIIIDSEDESEEMFPVPEEYGFGVTWQKDEKFQLSVDAGLQLWSNESYNIVGADLEDTYYMNGGFEYKRTTNVLADYFKRISYRAGFQYNKSYLKLRDIQLDEKVFSFGLGLPIQKQKSTIDFSVELGQYGTSNKNLIKERFVRLKVGFSLKDNWFVRRKYN